MQRHRWRLLLAAAAFLLSVAGGPARAQDYKPEYRLSVMPDATSPWGRGAQIWADLVRQRTKGRIKIRLYTGASLVGGDQTREFAALRQGVIDMAVGSTINWSPQIPEFNLFSLPFLLRDAHSMDAIMHGEVGRELFARIEEQGVVPLAWGENGFRELSNSRRPIRTPEDMRGLRFRVVGSLLFNDIFTALGAYPTQMNWSQVLPALKSREIDGQENPISIYCSAKLFNFGQRYVTLWDYMADPLVFVVNRQVWDSWTARDQEIVREAAIDAAHLEVSLERDDTLDSGQTVWQAMAKRGVKVTRLTPAERQRFVDATRPVYLKWKVLIGRDLVTEAEREVAQATRREASVQKRAAR
ncbi:MAG: DctP family TRAP transporter solute-binding subunit [Burkholderiales bacterium]|nr:DctP family TRAP transporter solute-binding subunit [Burkholderiales bacterium]MDE2287580.1 DctP family TRAP transporter solute-binding subunit [Burkholderiales bacterium]MDE2609405.1 DctP family TRAP transporter solute-binding subunit [Burkholderiales bacterium]